MFEIRPESKVSIAFIRAFRNNLDKTLKPADSNNLLLDKQTSIAIKLIIGEDVIPTDDLTNNLKQILSSMNNDMLKHIQKTYDSLLPQIVSQGLTQIEEYLQNNFSKEEVEALAVLAENDSVKKLTGDAKIFDILRQQWFAMHDLMKNDLSDYVNSTEKKELIRIAVQEFIHNQNEDDTHRSDGGPIDPDSIF